MHAHARGARARYALSQLLLRFPALPRPPIAAARAHARARTRHSRACSLHTQCERAYLPRARLLPAAGAALAGVAGAGADDDEAEDDEAGVACSQAAHQLVFEMYLAT